MFGEALNVIQLSGFPQVCVIDNKCIPFVAGT